ncbi:hypothetical protein [Rhodococcus globerulus]|jgi:hypothetical protein|uniref:hypothetical protein n=1 Tax=Rhodococcus globerulus TaxID=33008 RepID=UPI0027A3CA49
MPTPTEVHAAACEIASDFEGVRSYSGRNMFGTKCIAVVGERFVVATEFMFDLSVKLVEQRNSAGVDVDLWDVRDLMVNMAHNMRTDSMGLDTIFYWPHLELDDDLDGE